MGLETVGSDFFQKKIFFFNIFLPLLLPPPDIRRNFFRNWSLVGLNGGDGAVLFAVLGIPGVDSTEYCLDSIDGCLGEWVLKCYLKFEFEIEITLYEKNEWKNKNNKEH